jgi:predicted nucleic acid-binding protein
MEWLNRLAGTIVGLDTAPLIYFIERHPRYLPLVRTFFQSMEAGSFSVVTSALTLSEVLVQPYRKGDMALAAKYSGILLNAPNLKLLPISAEIADEAARIRAASGARIPDSIQLAAAKLGGATAFLTNDDGIPVLPGMDRIVLDRLLRTQ